MIGTVTCLATTLAPGAGTTCTGSYLTTPSNLPENIPNSATASGTPAKGQLQAAAANANVAFVAQPAWTLVKTPNPTLYSGPNQTINYSYLLTNTGNVAIGSIAITDTKVTTVTCPQSSLNVNGSMTCTGSYQTKAADVPNSIVNSATATGIAQFGVLANATAQATVAFTSAPTWTLVKTPNPTTYNGPNQTINYNYVLTTTGNVAISTIAVADNKIANVNCPATTLAVGASMTCTASYTTVAADVTNAKVTNTATATGTPAKGTLAAATAQATVNLNPQPSWTMTASANPPTFNGAGEQIVFCFTLTNTGNVPIGSISVTDTLGPNPQVAAAVKRTTAVVNCPANVLQPGGTMTCTHTYQTTANDVANKSFVNVGTAQGTPAGAVVAPVNAQAILALVAGTVTLRAVALGLDGTFTFTGSLVAANPAFGSVSTTGGNGSVGPITLNPGAYTVTENALLGYSLSGVSCTGDNNGTVNLAGRTATINLDGGEAVVCTFVNTAIAKPIPAIGKGTLLLLVLSLLLTGAIACRRRKEKY